MKHAIKIYFFYQKTLHLGDEDDLEEVFTTPTSKMLFLTFFLLNGARFVGSQPNSIKGTTQNITIWYIDSKPARVSWSTDFNYVEKYEFQIKAVKDK